MQERKKILIADDDAKNIFALKLVLQSKGYSCITAPGAHEAIELLRENPDTGIVLLDMMMPDMDGYEALQVLKSDKDTADIPVIAVTAQAMTGDKEKCLAAGADDYISKPIDIDALIIILKKYKV